MIIGIGYGAMRATIVAILVNNKDWSSELYKFTTIVVLKILFKFENCTFLIAFFQKTEIS